MDPILEILAMEPTTTTKIMVTIIYVARLEMLKKSGPAAGAKKHYQQSYSLFRTT